MCNFRKTDSKYDCTHCEKFTSYQAAYEDDLEPSEYGTCTEVDDMVGEEMICNMFINRYLKKNHQT
jgi:hypothetical protein